MNERQKRIMWQMNGMRELRITLGIKQRELAVELQVTLSAYAKWEAGECICDPKLYDVIGAMKRIMAKRNKAIREFEEVADND